MTEIDVLGMKGEYYTRYDWLSDVHNHYGKVWCIDLEDKKVTKVGVCFPDGFYKGEPEIIVQRILEKFFIQKASKFYIPRSDYEATDEYTYTLKDREYLLKKCSELINE